MPTENRTTLTPDTPVRYLKGVGPKTAERFEKLGIVTLADLLCHYPRRYIDFSKPYSIAEAPADTECVVKAEVFAKPGGRILPGGRRMERITAGDDIASLEITWFNNPYATQKLQLGQEYYFQGIVTGGMLRRQMVNPQVRTAEQIQAAPFEAVYPQTEGLSSSAISRCIRQLLPHAELLPDPLPPEMLQKYRLLPKAEAVRAIHCPATEEQAAAARRRLIYEELLVLQLGIGRMRSRGAAATGAPMRRADPSPFWQSLPFAPTGAQRRAVEEILNDMAGDTAMNRLLQGDVGSGKTLVFLKLIEHCLQMGRRALVLVPEISLTPQMILRLKSQFGKRVAVQHSALNHTERLLQWQMIQDGGADIVVGTRSAIFSPLENIGLVIIDEEQEHTYRSESAPRYSAHEVARQRAAENGALLLLASATPSTESYYAAQHGRTQLVRLTKRYGGNPLPKVQIVDMRAELASGNPREISLAMEDAIQHNLEAGKQTILLLNRRGYQTVAQCEDCREVLKCQKCSVPMVYHKSAHKLLCHYCGSQLDPPPARCPACGGKLQYRGFGTQKAEEELAKLFPEARILRMDQDTTAAKDAHEKLLAKFARHEYDIMVGTQMVAKGLDFEDVTLVGVLGIDSLLFAQGFRAYETVFSLVTQVVGRSGRAKDPGFAIIQTTDPDNPVLNLAAAQDYDAFFEQEIAYRKLGLYPPFCGLCVVGFAGPKESEVARASARFAALLGRQAAKQPDLPLRVLGPTPGSIEKINDSYRYKLTVKCRNDRRFRDLIRETLTLYEQEKLPGKATVVVDLHSDGDI